MVINALIKKASMFSGDSEAEKVQACFDKCLVLDPTSPDALIHRARVSCLHLSPFFPSSSVVCSLV